MQQLNQIVDEDRQMDRRREVVISIDSNLLAVQQKGYMSLSCVMISMCIIFMNQTRMVQFVFFYLSLVKVHV